MKLSDSHYFSHPAISNSKLSLINPDEGGSPELYLKGFDEKRAYSHALTLGTNVHRALLEPELFTVSEVKRPSGKLGDIVELVSKHRESGLPILKSIIEARNTIGYYPNSDEDKIITKIIKEGLEYYQAMKSDKIVMTQQVFDATTQAVAAVRASEYIKLLEPDNAEVFNEDVLFNKVSIPVNIDGIQDEIELELKVKIDNWSINFDTKTITINDLKTTGTGRSISKFIGYNVTLPEPKFIGGSFYNYRYYRQIAYYADALVEHVTKEYNITGDWNVDVNIIAVETSGLFNVACFRITNKTLQAGRKEYHQLLTKIAECIVGGFNNKTEYYV